MKTPSIAIALAAAMLTFPVGAAEWRYAGSYEPDNSEDDSNFMWIYGPNSTKDRIYFNGFTAYSVGIVSIGVNVNVGAIQSRMQPALIETYVAILGNWVDCNGDGYVGMAEVGLREYDAALLRNTTLCPPSTGDPNVWQAGAHNYNGWVTELIPVGTDGGQPSAGPGFNGDDFDGDHADDDNQFDQRILRDPQARVWGDFGLYSNVTPGGGDATETCTVRPFPRGTLNTTGGIIDWTDCHLGGAIVTSWNGAVGAAGDPAGLRFTTDDGRSSPIGRVDTLGSDNSSNAAITVQDCNSAPVFDLGASVNSSNDALGQPLTEEDKDFVDQEARTKIRRPAPATRDTTSPTAAGQANATAEELTFGGGGDDSDCNTANDEGADVYGLLEGDFEGTGGTVAGKRLADFNMEFEDNGVLSNTPRGGVGLGILGIPGVDVVGLPVHGGNAGATANNQRVTHDWFARVALVKGAPTRSAMSAAQPIPPADHITYYAHVGPAVLRSYVVPGSTTGTYGAPQCGSFTNGTHNGWDCDPATWYRNANGSPQPEVRGGFARPGSPYHLRDVDCEDGGNGLGIPLGPAALGVQACRRFA